MTKLQQYELDQLETIWEKICSGEFEGISIAPMKLHSEEDEDCMSIPYRDGTGRAVYERKKGGQWEQVPHIGELSKFI